MVRHLKRYHRKLIQLFSALIYNGPQNTGPMNLLFPEPTHRRASMVCFPYDDLERWRGAEHDVEPYPPELMEDVFREMSEGIREGMEILERAAAENSGAGNGHLAELLTMARTFYCHFRRIYCSFKRIIVSFFYLERVFYCSFANNRVRVAFCISAIA